MAKGAKTAAASVDSSAGTIKKALAGISGGAKGAWNSIGLFGKIGLIISAISLAYSVYHDINEKRNQILDDNINQGKTASEGADDLYSAYQKYQQALELAKTVGNDSAGVESAIEGVTKALGKQQEAVDGVTQSYKDMVIAELKSKRTSILLARNSAAEKLNNSYADYTFGSTYARNRLNEFDPIQRSFLGSLYYGSDIERAEAAVAFYEAAIQERDKIQSEFAEGQVTSSAYKAIQWHIDRLQPFVKAYTDAVKQLESVDEQLDNVASDTVSSAQQSRSYAQQVRDSQAAQIEHMEEQSQAYSKYIDAIAHSRKVMAMMDNIYDLANQEGIQPENIDFFIDNLEEYQSNYNKVVDSLASDAENRRVAESLKTQRDTLSEYVQIIDEYKDANTAVLQYTEDSGVSAQEVSERSRRAFEALSSAAEAEGKTVWQFIENRNAFATTANEMSSQIDEIEAGLLSDESIRSLQKRRDVFQSYINAITDYNDLYNSAVENKESVALQNLVAIAKEAGYEKENLADFVSQFDYFAKSVSVIDAKIEQMRRGLALIDSWIAGSNAFGVWSQLKDVWNSEDFADTKKELKELAQTVDGITPKKIIELASSNKELRDVLNTAGMTAQFLANIIQSEALKDGSGFEMITENALMLNYALNATADAFNSVTIAKSRYDEAMSNGEVDDNFKSFAQAYETLKGEIKEGRQGNAFWASAEYIFGSDRLEEWGYSVEKVAAAMANAKQIIGNEDSGGFGLLDKLYSLAKDGVVTANDGSVLAEIQKLSDGGYDFDIQMDQLDALSDKLGISKEAIVASLEALSLWGDVTYYDVDNVMSVMKEIGLASDSVNGTAVNVSHLTEQLSDLGYKGKALYDIKQAIASMDGVTLIDINGDINELTDGFVKLGVATQDGDIFKISADYFGQLMQNIGATKDEANALFNRLKAQSNIQFVDGNGQLVDNISFDEQPEQIELVVDVNDEQVNAFMAQNHDKTATLTYQVNVSRGSALTAGIPGFASGTNSAPGGTSLVGEKGEEIVQSGNEAYFVGTNGPELVNLKKGDSVYTAEETKKIKNGRKILAGRIPSFANGTKGNNSVLSGVSSIIGTIGGAIKGAIGKISGTVKRPKSIDKNTNSSGGGGGGSSKNDDKDEKVDWIERAIKKIEREIDKLKKVAESAFKSLGSKMSASADEIRKITSEIELQGRAAERYRREAESVELSDDLKKLVRDGGIDIQEYDEDTRKLISDYQKWIDKANECEDTIDDLHESLATLYQDNFNNIKADFDNQLGFIEHDANAIEHSISMLEAKGYMDSAKYYEQTQANSRNQLEVLNAEMAALEKSLSEAMASGRIEEGSEAWYSMKNAINETREKIDDTNLSLQETANKMRQIQWDLFDYGHEEISAIADEAEFLIDMMSDSELFDENGKATDTGLATMGLRGERYNVLMADADRYAAEIKRLNAEIANDPYNTTLLDRRKELISAQRESILAAGDEKDAIKDLVKQGIDAELQSMQDLIDKYNESLDTAKDLYEYQKNIKSQSDDIKSIQKQLAAYQDDMSEETKAKVQKLTVSLKDAQDKLDETEYQQYISDQKKLLDDLYSDYEEVLNDRLDDLDALVADVIAQVNSSGANICETLGSEAAKVGYSISDATKNIWNGSSATLDGVITTYGSDFSAKLTGVNASLSNILNAVVAMAEHSNSIAEGSIPRYKNGGLASYTGLAYLDGTDSNPEVVLNAADSKNLIALRDLLRRSHNLSAYVNGWIPAIDAGSDIMRLTGALGRMSESGTTFGDTNVYIDIDHVENYNDFVNKLRDDPNFDKMVRAMTTDRLKGGSAIAKTKYRW